MALQIEQEKFIELLKEIVVTIKDTKLKEFEISIPVTSYKHDQLKPLEIKIKI